MKKNVVLFVFICCAAFGQESFNPGLTIDCSGLHLGHRGKLVSVVKLTDDELGQIKKANTALAEAQIAHEAVMAKIKTAHGQTPECLGGCWGVGIDVLFTDDFALVYEWKSQMFVNSGAFN